MDNNLLCQLVRVLVSPVNSPGATASCQKSMFTCGLLQQLCTILMATGVPADILTEVRTVVSRLKTVQERCSLLGSLSEIFSQLGFVFFRPLTLCQRLSEAPRSTRTTLLLLMHPQTHQGKSKLDL